MNTREEDTPVPPAGLSSAIRCLRECVLDQWRARVTTEIPAAASLAEPVLVNMVPELFEKIAEALSWDPAASSAIAKTNLASAHGRERANMTNYSPYDVLHELHIFREIFFSLTKEHGLELSKHDAEAIGHTIEAAARESVSGFSEADREKSVDFIATLSHDLRNPLHVANASAQLIQLKSTDPGILNLAARICKKITEADAMIQTLLDASLRQGRIKLKLSPDHFNMMTLIEEVCADLPLLGQRIRVMGEPVTGYWCRASMKRVLENLISNAQKYGDAAEPITLSTRHEHDSLVLSVHNKGTPIPWAEMDRLFKPYQRMEDTSVKGWGLGLPFVQNVVESHGGTVVIDSDVARGTTFTVSLPVDARPYIDN